MIADQAGVDYNRDPARDPPRLPARDRPARARASPPARACSRTRCSWPPSRPTTSRSARRRCRSTRACRPTSSSAMERRYGDARAARRRHPGHGLQGRVRRHPRASLCYKLRKLLAWTGAEVLCTDPYVADDRLRPARRGLAQTEILVLGAPHQAYRALERRRPRRRRRVGRLTGAGHPAVKVLVTGAAGFIGGYLVDELLAARPRGRRHRQLQQVRPRREELRRPPGVPVRRGRRQGRRAADRARRGRATRSSPPRR